ncbi:MAG: homoserine dehydrogenase [Chloroflexota bacterium]|nr:homoserine dehydrogenase [Chloroflexota bacterium]
MTRVHRLALIGFGTVGQGFAEILLDKEDELIERFGTAFQIVAISDLVKGNLYQPTGLDLATLLNTVRRTGKLDSYPDSPTLRRDWDSITTIWNSNADTMIEVSWTDVQTGEPAISHVRAAFESGKNALLTNKGPVALAYRELAELARDNQVQFRFEGTVMSGTPAIRMAETTLAGCEINQIRGILNGTTNFILSQMEEGQSYDAALAEAQRLGYAEADPTADVEGWDAAGKAVILANVLMNGKLTLSDVDRTGITEIDARDIQAAQNASERWKLIARVWQEDGVTRASIKPTRVSLSHPLAGVGGASNALTFTTDLLGDVTLVGPGAGKRETGYAVLGDLLDIAGT